MCEDVSQVEGIRVGVTNVQPWMKTSHQMIDESRLLILLYKVESAVSIGLIEISHGSHVDEIFTIRYLHCVPRETMKLGL